MQFGVWIAATGVVLLLYLHRPKLGAIGFLLATLLTPQAWIGSALPPLRVELVLTPLILVIQIASALRKRDLWAIPQEAWLFAGWIIIVVLATVTSERDMNLFGLYAYVRLLSVMVIFSNLRWSERELQAVQGVFVLTSLPVAALCVGQWLDLPGIRPITETSYNPVWSSVVEMQTEMELRGYTYRAVGVFGNVSPTGAYFLATTALAVLSFGSAWAEKPSRRILLGTSLLASTVGGLVTLSGTYIGGLPFSLMAAGVVSAPRHRRQFYLGGVVLACVLIAGVGWARSVSETVDLQLTYQYERLVGGEGFTQRYGTEDGILADAWEDLSERPWIGWGATYTEVFVGDSAYFSVFHASGLIGAGLFALTVVMLMRSAWRARQQAGRLVLLLTFAILLASVSSGGMFLNRLGDWWWAAQGIWLSILCYPPAKQPTRLPHQQFSIRNEFLWAQAPTEFPRRLPGRKPKHGAV